MQIHSIFCCTLVGISAIAAQVTYWTNETCPKDIQGAIAEAAKMHQKAQLRIVNPQDTNQARAFEWLFKTTDTDLFKPMLLTTTTSNLHNRLHTPTV